MDVARRRGVAPRRTRRGSLRTTTSGRRPVRRAAVSRRSGTEPARPIDGDIASRPHARRSAPTVRRSSCWGRRASRATRSSARRRRVRPPRGRSWHSVQPKPAAESATRRARRPRLRLRGRPMVPAWGRPGTSSRCVAGRARRATRTRRRRPLPSRAVPPRRPRRPSATDGDACERDPLCRPSGHHRQPAACLEDLDRIECGVDLVHAPLALGGHRWPQQSST